MPVLQRKADVETLEAFRWPKEGIPALAVPVLLEGLEQPLSAGTRSYLRVEFRHPTDDIFVTGGPEAAAILLGECGPAARAALPALEQGLHDRADRIRVACAQAIWRIGGSTNHALQTLVETLDAQPRPKSGQPTGGYRYELVRAIEALEEMGPAARDAIPALKRVRPFSMRVRHAVDSALLRIEATP